MNVRLLVARALNETRFSHPPTYVATRFLADSLVSDADSAWTTSFVWSRYALRQSHGLFPVLRYKKTNPDGRHEHRDMLVPSPIVSIAQALLLNELSASPAFRKPSCVYSNRWPRQDMDPYNFQNYYEGYAARNRDAAHALAAEPGSIALVSDIERFYPSVRHETLRSQFRNRICDPGIHKDAREAGLALFEHMLAPFDGVGIATGPDMSHVLGDLALAGMDEQLSDRYPRRYFRYVDDIILVVPRHERAAASAQLQSLLESVYLSVNPDKTDQVSKEEWLKHEPTENSRVSEDSFESLVFHIKGYLARHPGEFDDLKAALEQAGFSLPMERLRSDASGESFRTRLRDFLQGRWPVALRVWRSSREAIVQHATRVRTTLQHRLELTMDRSVADTPTLRRWDIQRRRYLLNRLLYVLPPTEWSVLRDAVQGIPELHEIAAMIKMLQGEDCTELLDMPGPAVAACASLMRSNRRDRHPITLPVQLTTAAVHSASLLLLYGVADLPSETFSNLAPGDQKLLSFCGGQTPLVHEAQDFGYLDEIQCLQLHHDPESRFQALDAPVEWGGNPPLEGLHIGDEY